MSAADDLIAKALQYRFVREAPAGSNRSPEIDAWLQAVHAPLKEPWCAAFVTAMGVAVDPGWQVPRSASVRAMAEWAGSRLKDKPAAGDLILFYFPSLGRYAHVGIVTAVGAADVSRVRTIEGNTVPEGAPGDQREGFGVFERTRVVTARTKFLDWRSS